MKIKLSWVYLVLYVFGVLTAGILTGIYGNSIGVWISYCFLAAYGIMILVNAVMIEKIVDVKVEVAEEKLTPEQIKELPETLGEKKVEETTLETKDVPPEPPKQVQLSEEELKTVQKVAVYIKENLEKGHKLEKIREILEKVYTTELIDFVLKNALKVEEPELPDMGEPEEITPETLKKEVKKKGRPKKHKVEIVDPEHFK